MEGKLQTSFIPKKPLVENNKRHREPIGIFSIIGWFIFLASLAIAGGLYAYNQYLQKSNVALNAELTSKIGSFDNATIDEITTLNDRIEAAKAILNSHLAASNLLTLIANSTLQSVQFKDFNYSELDGGKLSISMNGQAPDFSSVALQSDTFSKQTFLNNQIFSGLTLNTDGTVAFKFTAFVDPNALNYSTTLNQQPTVNVSPTVSSSTLATSTSQ